MKTKAVFILLFLFSAGCAAQKEITGTFLSDGKYYPEEVMVLFSDGEFEDYYQSARRVVTGRWVRNRDTIYIYPYVISGIPYSGGGWKEFDRETVEKIWPQKLQIKNRRTLKDISNYDTLPQEYRRDTLIEQIYFDINNKISNPLLRRNNSYQIMDIYLDEFKDKRN